MDPWLAGLMVFLAGMLLVTEFLVQARGLAGIGGAALLSVYAISQTPGLHGWSVGLLLIGVLLLLLDGKLIQDGTLSALGLILMLVGLVLPTGDFLTGSLVAVMWILGLFSGLFSLKILPRRKLWDRLVLKQSLTSDTGYRSVNEQTLELVGRKGRAVSHLRPSGTIELDGERYSGISDGVWIEKETPIRVVSVDGTRILVEAHNDA